MIKCFMCSELRDEKDMRPREPLRIFGVLDICFDCIWRAHEVSQYPEDEYPEDLKEWLKNKVAHHD